MPKGYESLTMKPITAAKFRAIAAKERRSLVESLDIVADKMMNAIGVSLPHVQRRQRSNRPDTSPIHS